VDRRTDPTRLPGPDRHPVIVFGEARRPRLARPRCGTTRALRRSGLLPTGPQPLLAGRIGHQQVIRNRKIDRRRRGVPTTAGRRDGPSGSRPIGCRPEIRCRVQHNGRPSARRRAAGSGPTIHQTAGQTGIGALGVRGPMGIRPAAHRGGRPPAVSRRRVDHDERPRPSPRMLVERRSLRDLAAALDGARSLFRCWWF